MTQPTLAEAVKTIRELIQDGTADSVECEITRHGTMKIKVSKAAPAPPPAQQWRSR